MTVTRQCLALDLKSDPELQAAYRRWHRPGKTPVPIIRSIRAAGITAMEIYQVGDRLFMMMETDETFSPLRKAAADAADPDVAAWEELMDGFQKRLAQAKPGEKWVPAERIFNLSDH